MVCLLSSYEVMILSEILWRLIKSAAPCGETKLSDDRESRNDSTESTGFKGVFIQKKNNLGSRISINSNSSHDFRNRLLLQVTYFCELSPQQIHTRSAKRF